MMAPPHENLVTGPIGFPLPVELVIGFDPPMSLPKPPDRDKLDVPNIVGFTISDMRATARYTWEGTTDPTFFDWQDHLFIEWELQRSGSAVNPRPPVVDTPPDQSLTDAEGTVQIGPLRPGTYKLRGRVCQYSKHDFGAPDTLGQFFTCDDDWSDYSNSFTVQEPTPLCTLTTRVRPLGAGTVSPGGTYVCGTPVTLTATPNELYFLESWEPSGPRIVLNTDMTVTAVFGDICEVMPEVCPLKDEDGEGGSNKQPAPP